MMRIAWRALARSLVPLWLGVALWGMTAPNVCADPGGDPPTLAASNQVTLDSITSLPGTATDLVTSGSLVFVTVQQAGLKIYDAKNPKSPTLLGTLAVNGEASGVTLSGSYAYLAIGRNGMVIVNISNLSKPVIVGALPVSDYAWDIVVSGNTAFVSDDNDGLLVIDVTDPTHPRLKTSIQTAGIAGRLRYSNNRVYVSHGSVGMSIIDVTNPTSPYLLGFYDSAGWANDIQVFGRLAYIADGNAFRIIDITDPANIIELSNTAAWGAALSYVDHSISIVGGTDLKIFDVTNPGTPQLLATYNQLSTPIAIVYANPLIFVADQQKGLVILDYASNIKPVAPVEVLNPNGGEQFIGDSSITVHWKTDLYMAGTAVRLELWNTQGRVAYLGESYAENGETTATLTLPLVPEGADYHIRAISSWDPTFHGDSAGTFAIHGGVIHVQRPNTNVTWQAGTAQTIRWHANTDYAGTVVRLELWRGGQRAAILGNDQDPNGLNIFEFTVPDYLAPGTDYLVRAVSLWDPRCYDDSDLPFTIINPGYVKAGVSSDHWSLYR